MTTAAPLVPSEIDRVQRGALIVGILGLLACGGGWAMNPAQFFRAYLVAYLFWVGVGIGCMSIVMIHHLSGGAWGVGIRRLLEAGTRTLFFAALFFAPVALGMKQLYVWANQERLSADRVMREIVGKKSVYLNAGFFLGRAALYFALWALLAYFLNKWSAEQDQAPSPRTDLRLRGLAGGGLLLMGLTITFASVDWAMSLRPQWFSTIYGILFMVGQVLSAMSLMIVSLAVIGDRKPLADVISRQTVHDLGKLLLAFVMLWAYVSVSQFIIVWSGNLPEEIPWYLDRLRGGWEWIALALVFFHFALPFLLLLSRDLKRDMRRLAWVAGAMFVMRFVDLYWLIAPEVHPGALTVHWLDVVAPLGVGGIWMALFAWQLKGRPLVPPNDPNLLEVAARGAH